MKNPTTPRKVKFATQADPDVLAALRAVAAREGRQLQSLVDEALRDFLERRQGRKSRPRLADALEASLAQYDTLYRRLARP